MSWQCRTVNSESMFMGEDLDDTGDEEEDVDDEEDDDFVVDDSVEEMEGAGGSDDDEEESDEDDDEDVSEEEEKAGTGNAGGKDSRSSRGMLLLQRCRYVRCRALHASCLVLTVPRSWIWSTIYAVECRSFNMFCNLAAEMDERLPS